MPINVNTLTTLATRNNISFNSVEYKISFSNEMTVESASLEASQKIELIANKILGMTEISVQKNMSERCWHRLKYAGKIGFYLPTGFILAVFEVYGAIEFKENVLDETSGTWEKISGYSGLILIGTIATIVFCLYTWMFAHRIHERGKKIDGCNVEIAKLKNIIQAFRGQVLNQKEDLAKQYIKKVQSSMQNREEPQTLYDFIIDYLAIAKERKEAAHERTQLLIQ